MELTPVDILAALERDIGSDYTGKEYLFSCTDPTLVARSLLSRNLLKKLVHGSASSGDERALEKFKAANRRCEEFSEKPDDEFAEFLGNFKKIIWDFCTPYGFDLINHPGEFISRGMVGPGSSIGSSGFDAYSKLYASVMTTTDTALYTWYKAFFSQNPNHLAAESCRAEGLGPLQEVEGNRISFVPKNVNESRTIATEPLLNMIAQKGIGAVLTDRLAEFWDLRLERQQSVNRTLARRGSIDGTLCTIDLSSASDTISEGLVRWAFAGTTLLYYMEKCRCKTTTLPDGTRLPLSMWSTMGNGYTFPLQCVIFGAALHACHRTLRIPCSNLTGFTSDWAVNGDDIICRKEVFDFLCRCLSRLGFVVNTDKSFAEGRFRESCGGDYYNGHDVRSIYIRRLNTQQDIYVAINSVNLWSSKTGVPLTNLAELLLKHVQFLPVPMHFPISGGIRVPSAYLGARVKRSRNGMFFFKAFRPVVKYLRFDDSGNVVSKKVFNNPLGALCCFLGGYMRRGKIALRPKDAEQPTFYTLQKLRSPNWDTPVPSEQNSEHWQGWNSPVLLNMSSALK